jgi:predicted pyridoxine 5'-phosphate oxidase superfamily flavin-nucleotide-binding protein
VDTPFAYPSDVAFTPSVKQIQSRKGSRNHYVRMEEGDGWRTLITPDLQHFVEAQTSVFLATANAAGQPYIQHRGGPAGFLQVLDQRTIAFADFAGNRQYITLGNLTDNVKFHLFLIDYAHQKRVKVWGEARVVEDDAELLARLKPRDYRARAERAIVLKVAAWDANCPQHIPRRFDAADVEAALAGRDRRILDLEAELQRLKSAAAS